VILTGTPSPTTDRERERDRTPVPSWAVDITGTRVGDLQVTGLLKVARCPKTRERVPIWHAVRRGGGNVYGSRQQLLAMLGSENGL
jgi:hypothetical protein